MAENEKALKYVSDFIKDLLKADVSSDIQYKDFSYIVKVTTNDETWPLTFSKSLIDDFDIALEKYKGTNYLRGLETSVKFTFYNVFGVNNMLPSDFKISDAIISERREWIKSYRVDVRFDEEITRTLIEGLKLLSSCFSGLIKRYGQLDIRDITSHKSRIDKLIDYHKKHGNLNSDGAEQESLSYIKAAAVTYIIDLERQQNGTDLDLVRRAINKKIFGIVEWLRMSPFLDIKLPSFMKDISKELR